MKARMILALTRFGDDYLESSIGLKVKILKLIQLDKNLARRQEKSNGHH